MLIGTLKVEIIQKNFFFFHFFVNVVSLLQRTSKEEFIIWGLQVCSRFRVGFTVWLVVAGGQWICGRISLP